ncbi:MAG: hypothetical protein K2N94_08130 [Lachnospiraceae bacterium]|nr:hypothetical protein [Lachnospiraceae bacterium]
MLHGENPNAGSEVLQAELVSIIPHGIWCDKQNFKGMLLKVFPALDLHRAAALFPEVASVGGALAIYGKCHAKRAENAEFSFLL